MGIRSNTRTIHCIHIDLPDDVLAKIESGDQVEIMFNSSVSMGRMPRPQPMSWGMLRWVMGWDR